AIPQTSNLQQIVTFCASLLKQKPKMLDLRQSPMYRYYLLVSVAMCEINPHRGNIILIQDSHEPL
ncbi:hypothetical protein, partial [Limnofasciculus baicalensis]